MLLRGTRVKDIVQATGIGRMAIWRIKSNWRRTGRVVMRSLVHGRPRVLSSLEVSVSVFYHIAVISTYTWKYLESLVEKTPDIYGGELQYALLVAFNIDVDVSTIRRALHRRGFTYKKVRSSLRVEWVAQSGKP